MADAIAKPGLRPDPQDAERAAESANPSTILVTYPVTETESEMKARIKAGKPVQTFSFTVEGKYRG